MSTLAKTRAARSVPRSPTPAKAPAGAEPISSGRIALAAITPHPDNPRKTFDPQELAKLADSIRRHDVLQPVLVRPQGEPGQYQLVCGERRFRAAQLAGLETIPATVRLLDDAETLELMIVENEERENLTPIELAEGLVMLTKPRDAGGVGLTHAEAAARFSHEETWATNLMRLLSLPPAWRLRIASGEVPQTFGRLLLPYAKSRVVLEELEETIRREQGLEGLRRDDFEAWCDDAVRHATRPMDARDKPFYGYELGGHYGRVFKLTPEIEAELGVCELPVVLNPYGKRERVTLPRATNVKRWEELQAAAKEERRAKKAAKAAGVNGKGGGKSASGGAKGPSAAELKRRRAEQDASLARRAADWAEELVRLGVAREIKSGEWDWLARWFCRYYARSWEGSQHARQTQEDAAASLGAKIASHGPDTVWAPVLAWINPQDDPLGRLDELDRAEAVTILTPTPEKNLEISRDVVYRLAELTGVKLADEWKACRGERLLRFLEMHTMEQLTDLAKEWGEGVYTSKKQALVEDFRQSHSSGPRALPAVLKAAVPAAKKPKPR